MTKREIYETVVHLTEELSKIEIPQMITEALAEGDQTLLILSLMHFQSIIRFFMSRLWSSGRVLMNLLAIL